MISNQNVVLVLTGTITPFISFKLVANNPELRLKEYINTVKWYLVHTPYKVVFCENSGYKNFERYLSFDTKKRFEYITFTDVEGNSGAGYGECNILRKVQESSNFVKEASVIVKCTGRLILTNIMGIMQQFKNINHSFFAGDYAADFKSMNTTFFTFTPDLFDRLLEIQPMLSKDNYIEKAIMHFVHAQCRKAPETVLYFNRPLFISGRSGHYGTVYDTPKWKVPLRYLRKIYRIIQWKKTKREFLRVR